MPTWPIAATRYRDSAGMIGVEGRQVPHTLEEHYVNAWQHQRRGCFQKRRVPRAAFQAAADGENPHVTESDGVVA